MGTQSSSSPGNCRLGHTPRFRRARRHWPSLLSVLLLTGFPTTSTTQTSATSIPLLLPTTIVFDGSGTLYIAETNRHVIDRVDATGKLTVVAGTGTQGFSGDLGPANAAQLDSPQGLAFDGSGNLYIADTRNHRIRKVDVATGIITTVAGTGVPGYSGDQLPALGLQLSMPTALAADSAGNLYIADSNNHRIRKLDVSSGMLTTIAGNGVQADAGDNGPAPAASIDTPTGLTIDSAGNLYLADTHNHRIRRVDAISGVITTVAGGGFSLLATTATGTRLLLPRGVSLDSSGNLYLADTAAHRILRVAQDGTIAQVAGEGTQGFAGDNGPAVAALLDSPRSASISPAGLLTIADTGNQRVRKLNSADVITSLGGSGSASQPTLALSFPPTTQYGTGTLAASLPPPAAVTGSITFLETTNNLLTTLATAPLAANTATFSLSHLSSGSHQIIATYPGDSTHPAQQSPTALLTITPGPVAAAPTSATITYGQPLPGLTGSISGILPQDAALVFAAFSTLAQPFSPAATYPIAANLTGPAAGNYQITTLAPAALTIAQATTVTTLTAGTTDTSPITFTARTLTTAQSVPTGHVTFFDIGASIGSNSLSPSGAASISATLAPGTHTITAVYSGDTNFLSSTSGAVSPVVSTSPANTQDFTLTTSGITAQTTAAGSTAAYSFAISILNGPLSSPILLTASGMPGNATAGFNPTYIPPGGASATFTLTIQTARTTARQTQSFHPLLAMLLWGSFALLPLSIYKHARASALAIASAVFLVGSLTACGNTVSSNPKASSSTLVYPLTITATTTSSTGATLQHTAAITLTLQE